MIICDYSTCCRAGFLIVFSVQYLKYLHLQATLRLWCEPDFKHKAFWCHGCASFFCATNLCASECVSWFSPVWQVCVCVCVWETLIILFLPFIFLKRCCLDSSETHTNTSGVWLKRCSEHQQTLMKSFICKCKDHLARIDLKFICYL